MRLLICFVALLWLTVTGLRAHDVSGEMSQAAVNFLASLSPAQKGQAMFQYGDEERLNWHFIPRARKGLPVKEMSQEQRLLAHALLATGLSSRGYSKAVSIMSLESVLAELEKDRVGGPVRDPELYYFSIFGDPSGKEGKGRWGWRLEGHHLSLNFTAEANQPVSMTPSFFGTNPGEVRTGARVGTRILADEEELGRALVKSLDKAQLETAVLKIETPKEVFNDPKRVDPTKPEGIAGNQLNPAQVETLKKLIREYLGRHRPEAAEQEWVRIEQELPSVRFAWAGGVERGQPHYYRVQGTSFVLEYDNTQNEANHVHSLWRALKAGAFAESGGSQQGSGDRGQGAAGDVLRQHVAESHR